jgi:hypothetical protein
MVGGLVVSAVTHSTHPPSESMALTDTGMRAWLSSSINRALAAIETREKVKSAKEEKKSNTQSFQTSLTLHNLAEFAGHGKWLFADIHIATGSAEWDEMHH